MPEPINEPAQEPAQPTNPVEPTPPTEPATPAPAAEPVAPAAPVDNSGDIGKLKDQVSNLNQALQQERDTGGKKVSELEKKLEETSGLYDRIKQAVNPDDPEPEPQNAITKDDIESMLTQKFDEAKQEQEQSKKIEEYKSEIKVLEEKWNGKDGKPQYNDQEVLDWQRDNNKTYLSPQDAFLQMKHADILDYEVKQKIAGAKPVENVEKPSTTPGEHVPVNNESVEKNINTNTRSAVLEAMNEVDKEM